MRRMYRTVLIAGLVALAPVLAGCADFDMDSLDIFHLNEKKKLPGERKEVFPGGVPGVTQGIPPEYLKGNQQQADTALAPDGAAAPAPGDKAAPPAPAAKTAAIEPARSRRPNRNRSASRSRMRQSSRPRASPCSRPPKAKAAASRSSSRGRVRRRSSSRRPRKAAIPGCRRRRLPALCRADLFA